MCSSTACGRRSIRTFPSNSSRPFAESAMSSNPLDRLTRSFTFRLSLGYAALFTISAAILFGLLYLLLASALQHKDQEVIEARLREYAVGYGNGGLPPLRYLVQHSHESEKEKPFFVRVTGRRGDVLFLAAPDDWLQFDTSALD